MPPATYRSGRNLRHAALLRPVLPADLLTRHDRRLFFPNLSSSRAEHLPCFRGALNSKQRPPSEAQLCLPADENCTPGAHLPIWLHSLGCGPPESTNPPESVSARGRAAEICPAEHTLH